MQSLGVGESSADGAVDAATSPHDVLEARLQHQLAVARAERAERLAVELESRGARTLQDAEAIAIQEEQKARLAEERRVVAERQLAAVEERAAHDLRAAETRASESIKVLEEKLRAAEERARAAEARLPTLEATAKQAQARATSEAGSRELLLARAEASEARLGRLEAANHLIRQQRGGHGEGAKPLRSIRPQRGAAPPMTTDAAATPAVQTPIAAVSPSATPLLPLQVGSVATSRNVQP